MALRTKTIEYMLPMLGVAAGVAEGTTYTDSADTTIYIPETTSRTFDSVSVELICHDNYINNADPQAWGIRGSCDGGTTWTSRVKATNLLAESDEIITHVMVADMTAEFTARFAGTSDTFRYGFYIDYDATGVTIHNVAAKLIITYTYDDGTPTTKIKTVRIPIESFAGAAARLSNTAQAVKQAATAANQLPALRHPATPFLPEAGVIIRQAFLELWTNTMPSTTTNANLICKIDSGGAETTFGLHTGASQTPYPLRVLMDLTAIDWTSAHEVYARHNVASASYFLSIGGLLTVTYEYDEAASTRILNSLMMGFGENASRLGNFALRDIFVFERTIAEENPELRQSGVRIVYNTVTASTTFGLQFVGMSAVSHAPTWAAGQAGQIFQFQRVDGGSGAAVSGQPAVALQRGVNKWILALYMTTDARASNASAIFYLNYESDKAPAGAEVMSHSVFILNTDTAQANATSYRTFSSVKVMVRGTDYYLMGVMPIIYENLINSATYDACLEIQRPTTMDGGGLETVFTSIGILGSERQPMISTGSARYAFKRLAGDPDPKRIDPNDYRSWRWSGVAAQSAFGIWTTYNNLTKAITGVLSGFTGDGSGIAIDFFRGDTKEYIGSATTTVGGNYSFSWLDCGINIIGVARQAPDLTGAFYPKAFD